MKIHNTAAGMRRACAMLRATHNGYAKLGLVPTMGALHEGHLSLIRAAKQRCKIVAVSIFVNPTQFGPNEDFDRYPRTLEHDCDLLQREGVDLLFAPSAAEMYPAGTPRAIVDVPEVGARLDGAWRPGHFRAVATVVAKLFNIISPDVAFFGQKDAAQLAVLRAMIRDLNFPLEIVACPTVRDQDGLAMSSRNRYLDPHERDQARALFNALTTVRLLAAFGVHDSRDLRSRLQTALESTPGIEIEYADIVNPDTLLPIDDVTNGALVAVAARVGSTRLIDNLLLAPQHILEPA